MKKRALHTTCFSSTVPCCVKCGLTKQEREERNISFVWTLTSIIARGNPIVIFCSQMTTTTMKRSKKKKKKESKKENENFEATEDEKNQWLQILWKFFFFQFGQIFINLNPLLPFVRSFFDTRLHTFTLFPKSLCFLLRKGIFCQNNFQIHYSH